MLVTVKETTSSGQYAHIISDDLSSNPAEEEKLLCKNCLNRTKIYEKEAANGPLKISSLKTCKIHMTNKCNRLLHHQEALYPFRGFHTYHRPNKNNFLFF